MSKLKAAIDDLIWFCATTLRLSVYILLMLGAQVISMLILSVMHVNYNVYEGTWELIYIVIALVFLGLMYLVEHKTNNREYYLITHKNDDSDFQFSTPKKRDMTWCDGRTIKKTAINRYKFLVIIIISLGLLGIITFYLSTANIIADKFSGGAVEQALNDYDTAMDRYAYVDQEIVPKWDVILQYFLLVFCVPVVEELMFRGFVFGQYKRRMPFWAAALASAFLFGIIHGISIQIGYAMIAGVILSLVYYYCDSIYCSIAVHAIFNFLGGVMFSISTDFPVTRNLVSIINMIFYYAESFAILPTILLMIYLVKKGYHPIKKSDNGDITLTVKE
ncbi:MAG: CPBP family intramembrane metalloprotease [Clostridia bacterium]|nr:CPBP family intramembrane metalloprotease [Clostridia bacterium]